jgi:rhodanese-related sulfurtransferase
MAEIISPQQLKILLESDEIYALIDVRERNEYEEGQIFSASQIPRRLLELRIPAAVPVKVTKVVVYDDDSFRAGLAAATLERYGYTNIHILEGGINAWQQAGHPIVKGVHVLSKSFGEIVGELRNLVPVVLPEEFQKLLEANRDDYVIIEVRPAAEVQKTGSIPGAINIPGVELPLRITDYANTGKTIITTCAGRTRGFIAAGTLKLMGIEKVYDLNNGTLGWQLAGFELEQDIPPGPPPSLASRQAADDFAAALAAKQYAPFISVDRLETLRQNADKETVYLLDVRSTEEYELLGHIPGAISIPGGQAIQNADDVVVVHGATIIFVCDNATRATISAYWYKQMGFENVYVLEGGLQAWIDKGKQLERGIAQQPPLGFIEAAEQVKTLAASAVKDVLADKAKIIDVSDSRAFADGHLPGAYWVPRSWLEKRIENIAANKELPLLVTGSDSFSPVFGALVLQELGFRHVYVLDGGKAAWLAEGYPLSKGLEGVEPDDWHTHLTEYGKEEAKRYFEWEESLVHLPEYMEYFRRKNVL